MRIINLRSAIVSTIGITSSFKLRYPSRCQSSVSGVSELRKEYSDKALLESDVGNNPYNLFQSWFDEGR